MSFTLNRSFHPLSEAEYSLWLTSKAEPIPVVAPVVDYSHPFVYSSDQQNTRPAELGSDSGMDLSSVCVDALSKLNIAENVLDNEITNTTDTNGGSHSAIATDCESGMASVSDSCVTNENSSEPSYPLSFYDLMWMIEKGEQIPGVEELDIGPTNEDPTASSICRKKKPWEN